jgi:sortase B
LIKGGENVAKKKHKKDEAASVAQVTEEVHEEEVLSENETVSEENEEIAETEAKEIDRAEQFILSLRQAGAKTLSGGRRPKFPFKKLLSKCMFTVVICSLLAIIVWQGAEVVAAKIEYARSNDYYQNLADSFSLSKGDTGLISTLYGEKGVMELPDYDEMKGGAVILDKETLSSEEKKELAIYNAKLAALKAQNPDTVGWIHIPGTNIDYPVLLAPRNDPEFYMDHSFSGASYSPGAIFIEARCYGSILRNKNTIIVGHNIRLQGMMFNQLAKFGEEDFFKDHSEIYIYTEEGKFVFNLFSFYRVNYMASFRRVSFRDDNDFISYLQEMQKNSWYERAGISFEGDDHIITMYTCTNDGVKTNRYVAVALLTECLLNE